MKIGMCFVNKYHRPGLPGIGRMSYRWIEQCIRNLLRDGRYDRTGNDSDTNKNSSHGRGDCIERYRLYPIYTSRNGRYILKHDPGVNSFDVGYQAGHAFTEGVVAAIDAVQHRLGQHTFIDQHMLEGHYGVFIAVIEVYRHVGQVGYGVTRQGKLGASQPARPQNGMATRNMPLSVTGGLTSARYFNNTEPPNEWPIRILPSCSAANSVSSNSFQRR